MNLFGQMEKNFDKNKSQLLVNKLSKYGFNKSNGISILTENAKGNGAAVKNSYFIDGKGKFHHKHHLHLQKFNNDKIKTYSIEKE